MSETQTQAEVSQKVAKKSRLGRGLSSLLDNQSEYSSHSMNSHKENIQDQNPVLDSQSDLDVNRSKNTEVPPSSTPFETSKLAETQRIWNIAVENLLPNKEQPRSVFENEALKELSESIKIHGILQPIVARRISKTQFEIISGERRWRAAQLANLLDVPVILKEIDNKTSLELAIIENIQRQDLNPIEEAEAFLRLIEEYGLTQLEVAQQVGKERVTVANALRLLNLPPEVRAMVSAGELSVGQAKVLLSLTDLSLMKKVANIAKVEKLTVRAIEKLVAKILKGTEIEVDSSRARQIRSIQEELQRAFLTKVTIDSDQAKGKISFHFNSDDELNNLVEKFRGLCHS